MICQQFHRRCHACLPCFILSISRTPRNLSIPSIGPIQRTFRIYQSMHFHIVCFFSLLLFWFHLPLHCRRAHTYTSICFASASWLHLNMHSLLYHLSTLRCVVLLPLSFFPSLLNLNMHPLVLHLMIFICIVLLPRFLFLSMDPSAICHYAGFCNLLIDLVCS